MRQTLPSAIVASVLLHSILLAGLSKVFGADTAESASDLARVAVLTFINESNNADYEWVEKSLPDAINNSMSVRFEYVRQDDNKVMAIAARYKHVGGEYQIVDADRIAKESQTDILIYGNFRTNETKDQLLFKALIYNAQGKKVIGVVEDSSPLDAKIFKTIDRMAAAIVEKIYSYALAAEREKGRQNDLKILVLVPSFTTPEEEAQAIRELEVLKSELSQTFVGRYLTIYEFYAAYKVSRDEQEKSLAYAKKREREKIVSWLEGYGVRDAFIVFVADNKVAVTPVVQSKPAPPVTYAVDAKPEEKKASIAQASQAVTQKNEKVELTKETLTNTSVTMLHVGLLGGKGILKAGNNLGIMTGLSAQFGMRIWRPWLQPQFRFEGHYLLQKEPVKYLTGGTLAGGLGYTWLLGQRMALTPYAMGGVFAGVAQNTARTITFNLPLFAAGLTYTYFISPRWGISVNSHTQFVIDSTAPGLFFTGSLSWVYRF